MIHEAKNGKTKFFIYLFLNCAGLFLGCSMWELFFEYFDYSLSKFETIFSLILVHCKCALLFPNCNFECLYTILAMWCTLMFAISSTSRIEILWTRNDMWTMFNNFVKSIVSNCVLYLCFFLKSRFPFFLETTLKNVNGLISNIIKIWRTVLFATYISYDDLHLMIILWSICAAWTI